MNNTLGDTLDDLSAGAHAGGRPVDGETPVPDSILRIPIAVQVVLGSTRLPLSRIAALGPGSVIALDQNLGTPAVILVNGREVAKGDLFVIDGEGDRLGIRIIDVIVSNKSPAA